MAWHETVDDWMARLQPIRPLLFPVAIAIVLVAFAPARIAAALLGVLIGIGLSTTYMKRVPASAQSALLWVAVTVTADAAYARWNDLSPLTIVNVFSKFVDGVMKLVFPLIRGLGLPIADPRYQIVAVAPDFIWALILSFIALMSVSLAFPSRGYRADTFKASDRAGANTSSRPRAVA
jgi:hypothetical protein